jgi:glycosyltransferase involved in cell wall biosynthesis
VRIAHCVRSLDPADGGLPAIAQRLAALQADLGHETVLVTHDDSASAARLLKATKIGWVERVEHRHVPRISPAEILRSHRNPHVSDALRDIDVVHLHGVWDPILSRIAATARRRDIPYVVAPQGMLDPWSLRQKALKKRLALRLHYRRMLEAAACVHVLHEDEAKFARAVAPRCRTAILPNGVSLDEISTAIEAAGDDDYFQRRFNWPGKKTVLFLGRLHYKKGLDVLAEAFAHLVRRQPEARLVATGPDEGAQVDFERRINELGIAEKVAVPGPIYGNERYAAMRSAACFALPSRQEGFSIAVLEALACETPVVITPACHFPQVETAAAGAIGDNPAAHAAAYERYFLRPDLRRRAGQAGRQLVESCFEWKAIARSSIELYLRCSDAALSAVT